jgi:hypothetical protein
MKNVLPVEGFEPYATNQERLNALECAGIPHEILGRTLGVSEQTIKRWQKGDNRPRREAERSIDDIRAAMGLLMTKGFGSMEAAKILQSNRAEPPDELYIEYIVREPEIALKQISNLSPRRL